MAPKVTIVLKKCPCCNCIFLAEKGDRLHPYCSTEKPEKSDVKGNVITKLYDCRNPKCLKQITVYHYNTKSAFKPI
jgi:hypothetical protein